MDELPGAAEPSAADLLRPGTNADVAKPVLHTLERLETERRIEEQRLVVASLEPGSRRHEMATNILLLMRDTLHLVIQIEALSAEARGIEAGVAE